MEMAAIRLIQIVTVDGKMDLLHIVLLNLQWLGNPLQAQVK